MTTKNSLENFHICFHQPPTYTLCCPNGEWACSNQDHREVLAQHLASTFHLICSNQSSLIPEVTSIPVIPKEIKFSHKKKLNTRKAPEHDLITARLLQELPLKGLVMLAYIFNTVDFIYFPFERQQRPLYLLILASNWKNLHLIGRSLSSDIIVP